MTTAPSDAPLLDLVRRAVERGLSERFGGAPVRVAAAHRFPYSRVFRCTLDAAPGAMPATAIVRLPREGDEDARGGAAPLERERAALETLEAAAGLPPLAPRCYAGGAADGFLASEDLGTGPSLLDVLLGADPGAAARAALGFARALAALHSATTQASDALPFAAPPIADDWRRVSAACAALELPTPDVAADRDANQIVRTLSAPGATLLALSSGDPSVVNCKAGDDGTVRFFDFEGACRRHALLDAAVALRFPYPTGGPPWRLPPEVTSRIEAAYRSELARGCPAAEDDTTWHMGIAAGTAAWAVARLLRLPRVDAGPDRDAWPLVPPDWPGPVPERSRRRQLVAILETALASPGFPPGLAAWFARLADALRAHWPEAAEPLPLYRAFVAGSPPPQPGG